MRFLSFFIGLVTVSSFCLAQESTESMTQTTRDRINFTNLTVTNNNTLFTIKGAPGRLIGNPYLDTTWQAGNVKFYTKVGMSLTADSLAGVPVRLDLSSNELEIRAGDKDVKAAKATAVRYVDVNNAYGSVSRLVNVHEYEGEAESLNGFFDLLVKGKLDLLQHPSVYIRKANYNVAMNTGTKDDEFIKKLDWYVARDKKAVKFSPGKKAVLELMTDKKDQIETFLKTEKPDLKTRSGLVALFSYYNKLER